MYVSPGPFELNDFTALIWTADKRKRRYWDLCDTLERFRREAKAKAIAVHVTDEDLFWTLLDSDKAIQHRRFGRWHICLNRTPPDEPPLDPEEAEILAFLNESSSSVES